MPGKSPSGRVSRSKKASPSTAPTRHPDMLEALEAIVERSSVIAVLWRHEPGAPIDYISNNIRRFGYEPEEFTSGKRAYFDAVHPDDRKRIWDEAKAFADRGVREYRQRYRFLTRSGEVRWIEDLTTVPTDDSGRVTHTQGMLLDVTEQQAAAEALSRSEAQHKSLYGMVRLMCDNVPDLMWAKDLDKRYLFANRAMCEKLLGALTTSEPVGKTDMFFAVRERAMHPENPRWHTFGEICADSDSAVIAGRKPMRFDEFGNVKGKFLFLDVYKAPFWDERGNMIGTVGCGRDVTAEKEAEKRRQAAEAKAAGELAFRKAIEASMDAGVVTADMEGRHTYANAAFTRMTGWTGEEMSGLYAPFPYWPEEEKERIMGVFRAIFQGEAPPPADLTFMHKDGGRVPVRLVFSPLVGGAGEQLGWMAVVHDLSRQNRSPSEDSP